MKSGINRMVIALVITALTSVMAFAKGKSETVTFVTNMQVNGTLVKKGTYDVKFDEQTSELSIVKGSKVVAKSATRIEKRNGKAKNIELRSVRTGDEAQLLSVTFGGSDQNIVLSQGTATNN
jgi:hypothetical protein